MNLFATMQGEVLRALDQLVAAGELPTDLPSDRITVAPPRDGAHGEMATNAALILAKAARRNPRDLAGRIADALGGCELVARAEVAGAGFVNLTLHPSAWHGAVAAAISTGSEFGRSEMGGGRRVNVEFVSANPTGPLHVGHARGAVFGDALASLLDHAGYRVTREYYVNDAGAQVDTLARSAYLRYREALGETVELPADAYPGDYLKAVGQALADEHGDRFVEGPEVEWLDRIREFAVDRMMAEIREDLSAIGVEIDLFVSERALQESGRIDVVVARLRDQDLVYQGTLPPPKGAVQSDWEAREQLLFRSTRYGDDTDRPLQKADGSWTYFAPDLAYHVDKIDRGFETLIDVWGEDHGGYVRRMRAAVLAVSDGSVAFDVKLCRMVRLLRDGEPFAMSKRSGKVVLLRDFLDEVGRDVARFILLSRKNDAALDIDVVRGLEQTRDNPVFYVHYANARIHSVFGRAAESLASDALADAALAKADLTPLAHAAELALARRVAAWPATVEAAAAAHEPHRVSYYLQALAGDLHGLWTVGQKDPSLRFVQSGDEAGTIARLALLRATAIVIHAGLGILGIEPREEMC